MRIDMSAAGAPEARAVGAMIACFLVVLTLGISPAVLSEEVKLGSVLGPALALAAVFTAILGVLIVRYARRR